jgi:hypothetical protein
MAGGAEESAKYSPTEAGSVAGHPGVRPKSPDQDAGPDHPFSFRCRHWLRRHWLSRLANRKEQDRTRCRRKLGWKYDDTRGGRIDYRFAGSERGVDWSMWYDSDRGDKSPTPKATWSTANIRTPELSLVIIGRKRFQIESGAVGRILMGVVSGVAQAMTGSLAHADKAEFYESAMTLEEGGSFAALRGRGRARHAARLAGRVAELLLDWPEHGAAAATGRRTRRSDIASGRTADRCAADA